MFIEHDSPSVLHAVVVWNYDMIYDMKCNDKIDEKCKNEIKSNKWCIPLTLIFHEAN